LAGEEIISGEKSSCVLLLLDLRVNPGHSEMLLASMANSISEKEGILAL